MDGIHFHFDKTILNCRMNHSKSYDKCKKMDRIEKKIHEIYKTIL